ncbi:hypothetical protein LSS_20860 [Leptospira santarosai serovar Shermani str. LT 821]|uniref:Uncharacterized protein n=1 Tax=Leptospira santarosai serovar Shermani str. LT 821 TaxID=758847 RepID=A0A097ESC8_9LEPT|nr:hypothetical protein LSS_20860 [Leptospira santarosai serovar Shermani str. LT 821]
MINLQFYGIGNKFSLGNEIQKNPIFQNRT